MRKVPGGWIGATVVVVLLPVALAAAATLRWLRAGDAVSVARWAEDPIGPDDLAG